MEKTSHREYKLWLQYLQEEWTQPKPSDYYLMQIAQEVRRVLSKKPNDIKLSDFELFSEQNKPKKKMTKQEKSKAVSKSKSVWMGIVSKIKPTRGKKRGV